MDSCEATRVVYSRIQNLDPENASKIMGLLLMQDQGEKEMIRLAYGPESLLHSVIFKARKELEISSNTPSSPSTPLSPFPFSPSLSRQNSSSRIINGVSSVPSPLIIPNPLFSWTNPPNFSDFQYPEDIISPGIYNNNCGPPGLSNLRFGSSPPTMVGSPSQLEVMEQFPELFRSKSAHQYRLAAASQLMGGSSNFPYSPNKCMNLLLRQQQNVSPRAAALMMEEEMDRFGRNQNEFSMGMGMVNPSSRQIYMTFQADCTFTEEDVSNYFSIYGPVLDVRIPYQQKRMFGFVTFVYPETVKLILAKGNPHFVGDARILVKPYKEKGNIPDKFREQQQQMERREYLSCGSPTIFESRDPFYIEFGERMLWRRKLEEQANLQQAIELQNRRLMSLQLLDVKRNRHHRALSAGAAIPSATHSPSFLSHSTFFHSNSDRSSPDEDDDLSRLGMPVIVNVDDHQTVNGFEKEKESSDFLVEEEEGKRNGKSRPHNEESDFQESMKHNLPDSLFASPEASIDDGNALSTEADEVDKKCNGSIVVSLGSNNLTTTPLLPATS